VEDSPTWSPDGQTLAYTALVRGNVDGESDNWDIWVARVGGERANRTADYTGKDVYPSWSHDGSQIEDLDIFVAPEPDNIERLKKALQSVYPDDASIEEITAEDLLGDYPAVQYVPPDGDFYLDILTRLGEAFRYEDISSQRLDFDGLTVSVATPEILYRMKKDTVRPKDWGDAEALRRRFDLDED